MVEIHEASVSLVVRALVASARWAGRTRRLCLEQARGECQPRTNRELEARVVMLVVSRNSSGSQDAPAALSHENKAAPMAAPARSMATSHADPERLQTNSWCHSSRQA